MRIKILFFLILLSTSVFSQKIDEEQVPKDVLIAIETVYSGVKVKSWELKDNNYFATVKVDGQSGKAEITPEGKWLNSKFNVSEKELPSSVTTYMSDNFDGFKIKVALYIEDNEEKNYYEIKIQKKGISSGDEYELTFDTKGTLLNSTAPESAKTNKKKEDDEDSKPVKKDKVAKKDSKYEDDEDTKTDDKPVKKSKVAKKSKEDNEDLDPDASVAKSKSKSKAKTKSKKDDEEVVADDDKPVKKSSTAKKSAAANADRSSANKNKNQKTASSSKGKKSKNNEDGEESTSRGGTPSNIKKAFDKKFPNNEEAKWVQVDSNYIVTFFLRDVEQKAEFSPEAKLVATTSFMEPKNLFRPLENYLEKNYKKYKVLSAEKVTYDRNYAKLFPEKKLKSYYMVKISEKVKGSKKPKLSTIYFDSKGTLDRIDEGDFDDDDDSKKKKDDEESE